MKNNFPKIFSIVVGSLMLMMWLFFLISGQVPELKTSPWEISLHLAAEFLTAVMLILSAITAYKKYNNSQKLMLFAHGMLAYTLIVSPGYYAQSGSFGFVFMFAALLILDIISALLILKS